MARPRLPWFKMWIGSSRHHKVVGLSDRAHRVWTELLEAASEQKVRGRFESYAAAAAIIRRKDAEVRQVAQAGLMDESDDGVWMHDWKEWQRWRPEDADAIDPATSPDEPGNHSNKTQQSHANHSNKTGIKHRNDSSKSRLLVRAGEDVDVDREEDVEGELRPETKNPPNPPAGGKRAKPAREVLTQVERTDLIVKWQERYGGMANVADEIDAALNHTARLKFTSERLYVNRWLSKELHWRPGKNGRAAVATMNISVPEDCMLCGRQNIMLAYHQCPDDTEEGA